MTIRKGCWCLMFVALAFLSVGSFADDQADYQYRAEHGAENTIWMKGLLQDYHNNLISESDLMRELWAERPATMTSLYSFHGTFNQCFEYDLVYLESNSVIGQESGHDIFFSTAQYLDSQGHVISGYEKAYNNATRANGILTQAKADRAGLCPGCPATNTCWTCPLGCNCDTPKTGAHCEINGQGNPGTGCHMCAG